MRVVFGVCLVGCGLGVVRVGFDEGCVLCMLGMVWAGCGQGWV